MNLVSVFIIGWKSVKKVKIGGKFKISTQIGSWFEKSGKLNFMGPHSIKSNLLRWRFNYSCYFLTLQIKQSIKPIERKNNTLLNALLNIHNFSLCYETIQTEGVVSSFCLLLGTDWQYRFYYKSSITIMKRKSINQFQISFSKNR